MLKAQSRPAGRRGRQACGGDRQHGGGAIEAQHPGRGVTLRQQKADVAGSATQIDDPRPQLGPEQRFKAVQQGAVTGGEVGVGIGARLLGVVHQLGLADPLHGHRRSTASLAQTLPLVHDEPCAPHRWGYGFSTRPVPLFP